MAGESYTTKRILLKSTGSGTAQYFIPYINNATSDQAGIVKPDGTTISVDSNGVISASHQTIKQDGITGATVNRFGTCTTAAGTAAKTVNITTGTFSLEAGARVSVKFNNANTANSPTLSVNSTTAKDIFFAGSKITSSDAKRMLAGTVDFIYDGTQWQLVVPNWEAYLTARLDSLVNTLDNAV